MLPTYDNVVPVVKARIASSHSASELGVAQPCASQSAPLEKVVHASDASGGDEGSGGDGGDGDGDGARGGGGVDGTGGGSGGGDGAGGEGGHWQAHFQVLAFPGTCKPQSPVVAPEL